jgi:hypothetical protein
MAATKHFLLLILCFPTLSVARRKMTGSGKINAKATEAEDAAGSLKWDYETAKTAWDVLCHNRQAGVFKAEWKESSCFGLCHHLKFQCDPDDRVETIPVNYGRITSKTLTLQKSATPVTTDGLSFRFFLNSEGCPFGEGDEDCELPWETYDDIRNDTSKIAITRRFLHYDARKEGSRALSVEKNVYEAYFYKSAISTLGTGTPLPELTFAGAKGTGCGVGVSECSAPVQGPEPVPETTVLDVTQNYITELDTTPGYVSMFSNRNWAKTTQTKVNSFELKF